MKVKHGIFILTLLFIIGAVWFYHNQIPKSKDNPSVPSQTQIQESSAPMIQEEVEVIPEAKATATPISQKKQNRSILGTLPQEGLKGLRFLNSPTDEWKEKYEEELRRFQDPESQIEITLQESGIQTFSNKTAIYIEKVLVIIRHTNGKEDSFNALVDSTTGKVIQTFNFVKRDDIPLRGEERQGMTPTGVIRNTP